MGKDFYMLNNYLFYRSGRVDEETWTATNQVPPNTRSHCIGPEANVWSAAAAVLLLMTLGDVWDLSDLVRKKLGHRNLTRDDDSVPQYLIEPEVFDKFLTGKEQYSDELKNLVRECTRLEPQKRPPIDTILDEVHAGIQREYERLHGEFDDLDELYDATRMAFTNEQWLKVPEGPFKMMPRSKVGVTGGGSPDISNAWSEFHHVVEEWADPSDPTLVPPGQWRIFRHGDGGPVRWTAAHPEPDVAVRPAPLPYYGSDWILYTARNLEVDGYHQGPPLPKGGRAWKPQPSGSG